MDWFSWHFRNFNCQLLYKLNYALETLYIRKGYSWKWDGMGWLLKSHLQQEYIHSLHYILTLSMSPLIFLFYDVVPFPSGTDNSQRKPNAFLVFVYVRANVITTTPVPISPCIIIRLMCSIAANMQHYTLQPSFKLS